MPRMKTIERVRFILCSINHQEFIYSFSTKNGSQYSLNTKYKFDRNCTLNAEFIRQLKSNSVGATRQNNRVHI